MTYAIDELGTNLSQFSWRADKGRASTQSMTDQTKKRIRSNIAHCVGTERSGDQVWVDTSQKKTLSPSAGTLAATQNKFHQTRPKLTKEFIKFVALNGTTNVVFQVFLKIIKTNS